MSKILLYIDKDSMDEDFVQALRTHNVDVLTVADAGMLHRSDEEQLDWAMTNDRVIFSFNTRDFYKLHTTRIEQDLSHGGIILAPQQRLWYWRPNARGFTADQFCVGRKNARTSRISE